MKSNQPLNYGNCPPCNSPMAQPRRRCIALPGITHSYCAHCQDWRLTTERPRILAAESANSSPSTQPRRTKKSAAVAVAQPQQIDLLGGAA